VTLVQHILEDARRRLAVLNREASVIDAAAILADAVTPLAIVCDSEGRAVGVVTRSDIVKLLIDAKDDAFRTNAEMVMTTDVLSCHPDQSLQRVWKNMSARGLRCAPVLDDAGRPQGVVHARDLVRALLDEVTHEELLLRDYVMGIGYQ
jgi:CBS domain-containing protein